MYIDYNICEAFGSVRKKDRTEYKKVVKLQQIRLDINFDKSTIELYFILISFLLVKFFKKSKINSYVINQIFKFQVFVF